MRQSARNNLESITFENRAWLKSKYPRLHMKEPEKFAFTKTENFEPVTKEIHLTIGYHREKSHRSGVDSWYLDIDTYKGKECYRETKIFRSIEEIKAYIREKYSKNPIFPDGWN